MRTIVERVIHAEVARILVHFPQERLDCVIIHEMAPEHALVPSGLGVRICFVVRDSTLLEDLITEELSERVRRVITTRKHHAVEELLQAEAVTLDQLRRRAYYLTCVT